MSTDREVTAVFKCSSGAMLPVAAAALGMMAWAAVYRRRR
jgi:hypothetical protein